MKLNRKTVLISAFLFMDCMVGGVIIGKAAIKNATRRLFVPENHEVRTIEDSMLFVNEGVTNFIEYSVATEEDLAVAQEIIMNEQEELILEQKQISQAIITSNKQVEAAKAAKIKAAQEAKAKAEAVKLAEERRKKAEEDAKQLQIALAQEAKAKAEAESKKVQTQAKEQTSTQEVTSQNTTTATTTKVSGYDVANYALKFNGKSYVFGGQWNGELPYTGTDCSGYTQGVYKHFGINIPRVARDQARAGYEVALKDIQPGDLVFYSGNGGRSVTHAAMYIGNGKIIHAQTPSLGIGISNIRLGTLIRVHIRRVI